MDNYEREEFEERLDRLVERSFDEQFENLTQDISLGQPCHTNFDIYQPDTCHPKYKQNSAFVTQFNKDAVRIPKIGPRRWTSEVSESYPATVPCVETTTLHRNRMIAPAPYVGNPMQPHMYVWDVWVDPQGCHIAGPAKLVC